jgi:hypothetical protein
MSIAFAQAGAACTKPAAISHAIIRFIRLIRSVLPNHAANGSAGRGWPRLTLRVRVDHVAGALAQPLAAFGKP